MNTVKTNLGKVVKYKRDGYSYITLYYINTNNGSSLVYGENLEKVTFNNYEEVKDISDRVDKEMMQIQNVVKKDEESRMFVEYNLIGGQTYFVVYDKTKENEDAINAIRDSQNLIRKKEKNLLQVKETKKGSRASFLKGGVFAVLALGVILSVNTLINKAGNSTLTLLETTKEPLYSFSEGSKPTLMPIPESLSEFAHTETVVQTNPVVQQPVYVQPVTPVETPRQMVVVQPEPVTDNQEEQVAVKRIRAALDEAARMNLKAGAIFNNATLYNDDAILAAYKLINDDFSFLSDDDAARYEQVNQSIYVYKDMQMAYVVFGLEDAKIANNTKDPYRRQKLNLVETQARNYYLKLMAVKDTKEFMDNNLSYNEPTTIAQTYDESDPVGDFIVSGYRVIEQSFSTQPLEQERLQAAIAEIENMNRFMDDCAAKAKQR